MWGGENMKIKRLTMEFVKPLDRIVRYQEMDVPQDAILAADIDGIRAEVRKRLNTFMRRLGFLRFFNKDAVEMMQLRIGTLDSVFEWMIEFKKISPTKYILSYPLELTALLKLKRMGIAFGPLKMKEKDLYLFQILEEKKLVEGLKRFTFKEMQLNPVDYTITSEELESSPEGENEKVQP
jgi:hypothetical protein